MGLFPGIQLHLQADSTLQGGEDKESPEYRVVSTAPPSTMYYRLLTIDYICVMEVNDALVQKLARLARLRFDDAEKEEIKNDLQRMIAFVEKLNELDLEGIQPLMHMTDEVNVLREDEVSGSITREEALKNAPAHDEQFFKVPKVIKKTKQ